MKVNYELNERTLRDKDGGAGLSGFEGFKILNCAGCMDWTIECEHRERFRQEIEEGGKAIKFCPYMRLMNG